jgi:hypothetical protein
MSLRLTRALFFNNHGTLTMKMNVACTMLLALACLEVRAGFADAPAPPPPPTPAPARGAAAAKPPKPRPAIEYARGKLSYVPDEHGNRVIDFSYAGYMGGGVLLPDAPVRVTVPVVAGEQDATARIQAAIDYVSSLQPDARGIRGAVLLEKGTYPIGTALSINASGVVLRGQGQDQGGTVLLAKGLDRRTLIQIAGVNDQQLEQPRAIADKFVPVNAMTVHLANSGGLKVGDTVEVRRPSTRAWIDYIGMYQFPGRPNTGDFRFSWKPGQFDLFWDRTVASVQGNAVTLDAPLTTTLDSQYTSATLAKYQWPGLITQVGIENLRCDSEYSAANPLDEEHSWIAIGMENVQDSWVRQVTAAHFAGSAVSLLETAKRITVEDSQFIDPVSEVGGYRRHAFYTAGQQTLFLRCHSENARHDFAIGYEATGPSAVVNCDAKGSLDFSGTIESWSSGILFDHLLLPDNQIRIDNLEVWNQGAGWSGANCMLWNCQAPVIALRTPPGEENWAFGVWGVFTGEGPWGVVNEWADPDSLYMQQLEERLGANSRELLYKLDRPQPVLVAAGDAKTVEQAAAALIDKRLHPPKPASHPLVLKNGWLTVDDQLLVGTHTSSSWWQGHVDPQRAPSFGPAITRFAPGRTGRGATDDLNELTDSMKARGQVAFEENWGLWYDERRQDHEQVHRMDGNVEPPFFEQAWARSGQGKGYDGLSKYDLTKFNPWYFSRLHQFAELGQQKGLLLINEMYFQHHLLEDVAHWMDVPWRVTNALQDIGLPEPPPTMDRKRIIIANIYYDVTQPKLREFHRNFIRYELEALADQPNVIHTTGEEYNGPLSFTQFWLDTVAEWERETGKHPLIGLCCTRDVQDAILADPVRCKVVDVIDFKNWWYTSKGTAYDPPGGQQVAPRKQLTGWKGPKDMSPEGTLRQVREYRAKFPDKAIIITYGARNDGWGIVAAGGSMTGLRADPRVLAAIPKMKPWTSKELQEGQYGLAEEGQQYLVYAPGRSSTIRVDLQHVQGNFAVQWINGMNISTEGEVAGGAVREFKGNGGVLWLTRK